MAAWPASIFYLMSVRCICVCVAAFLCAAGSADSAIASETKSQSFSFTGAEQQFVAPAGVSSVQVALVGGHGGSGAAPEFSSEIAPGGMGSITTGMLAVTPGEVLFVEVGGPGGTFGEAGYNGGGAGAYKAGGGGGASDVRTCSIDQANSADPVACGALSSLNSRLLVAGGGGGGGNAGVINSSIGGAGGGAGEKGEKGALDHNAVGGTGGGPGLQSTGGTAGENSNGFPAAAGGLGIGGAGGYGYETAGLGGGGGGGSGLFGGGGGGGGQYEIFESKYPANGAGGGGGGGSSGAPAGTASVSDVSSGPTSAATSATFTWTLPAPTVTTGPVSSVLQTSASLSGTVNPNGSTVSSCAFLITPAPPSGGSVPCLQQVGSGSAPFSVSASATGLALGSDYAVTLVATSAQGTTTGTAISFATEGLACAVGVAVPPAVPSAANCGGYYGCGAPPAQVASAQAAGAPSVPACVPPLPPPAIGALKLSPTRFRRSTRAAAIAASKRSRHRSKVPTATTISFHLSENASVSLRFQRESPGVTVGRNCEAPSRQHKHGKRCTRYTAVPQLVTLPADAGSNRIAFDGVLEHGVRLPPGIYRLSLSASNVFGSTTAAQHPAFTLLR
jgi:hypothetical protein